MKVVVLGAGLAGLSAADLLARRGCSVVVLEKEPHPGGLARTVQKGGFRYDLGPHRFHTLNDEVLEYVRGLPGIDLLELSRVSRIRLLDRYFDYPLSLPNVLSTMPLHRGGLMLASYLWEKFRSVFSPREQKSFEGWVLSRFGRALYELYLAPYNRKLWGMEPSHLSADWASQRITVPNLAGLVRETVAPSKKTVRSLVSTFYYPVGGIGRISRGLAQRITSMGGVFHFSAKPVALQRITGGWSVRYNGGSVECDAIINTIPVNDFVELLGDIVPRNVHEASTRLRFRSLVFLTVRLKTGTDLPDHWIYTSEDRYLFNRLSIPQNFNRDAAPQVVFEYSCQNGDDVWRMSKSELLRATIPGAEHLGVFSREMVLDSDVNRQEHAYPIYELGYAGNTSVVLDALEEIEGSVTCGRQGLFRYNNMDHSIEMGRYAALEILGEASVKSHFNWNENVWADG